MRCLKRHRNQSEVDWKMNGGRITRSRILLSCGCNHRVNADLSSRRFADRKFRLADTSVRFCRRHRSDWYSFTDPGGMEGSIALVGPKCVRRIAAPSSGFRTIRLRFDRRSTPVRLYFTALRPFDDLHYDRRPTRVRAAALRPKMNMPA